MSRSARFKQYKNKTNLDKMNIRINLTCKISKWLCISDDELYNLIIKNCYIDSNNYKIYNISDVYGDNFYINVHGKYDGCYIQIKPGFENDLKKINEKYLDLEPIHNKSSIFSVRGIFASYKKNIQKNCYLIINLHIKSMVHDLTNGAIFLVINVV
jgi:hypothetical protein